MPRGHKQPREPMLFELPPQPRAGREPDIVWNAIVKLRAADKRVRRADGDHHHVDGECITTKELLARAAAL